MQELIDFFNNTTITEKEVRLNQCETITDIPKFIETHIAYLKNNSGNKIYLPYYNRLCQLKTIITALGYDFVPIQNELSN